MHSVPGLGPLGWWKWRVGVCLSPVALGVLSTAVLDAGCAIPHLFHKSRLLEFLLIEDNYVCVYSSSSHANAFLSRAISRWKCLSLSCFWMRILLFHSPEGWGMAKYARHMLLRGRTSSKQWILLALDHSVGPGEFWWWFKNKSSAWQGLLPFLCRHKSSQRHAASLLTTYVTKFPESAALTFPEG